jgi:hypothetical protein
MSPPEIWGPAVWTLFHTLIEKMNSNAYPHVINSMFGMIIRICKVLPCPECSKDASNFLAKIKLDDYKNKTEFKNMLYLFHNWVNAKKKKRLFNYVNMNRYNNLSLIYVMNNFISKYNTKGNMKLLTESFQRSFVVKDFITWFRTYSRVFIQPNIINNPQTPVLKEVEENRVEESIVENNVEESVEENNVEESVEENRVEENPVLENNVEENPVLENAIEVIVTIEENIVEENHLEECVAVEENHLEEQVVKKKGKKNKSKK